jgi:type I restriction enzyme R subunit
VQEKKFADRLQETLRKYNNRAIETAQVIEELIQMAKEFQAEMEREAELGLNPDEVAFLFLHNVVSRLGLDVIF